MSETETEDWHARAAELQEHGGVPPRRAEIVALREQGLTYRAIADELDLADHGSVRTQVVDYLEGRDESEWVLEHGPGEDDL